MDKWQLEEGPHLVIYTNKRTLYPFYPPHLLRSDLRNSSSLYLLLPKALDFSDLRPKFCRDLPPTLHPISLSPPFFASPAGARGREARSPRARVRAAWEGGGARVDQREEERRGFGLDLGMWY